MKKSKYVPLERTIPMIFIATVSSIIVFAVVTGATVLIKSFIPGLFLNMLHFNFLRDNILRSLDIKMYLLKTISSCLVVYVYFRLLSADFIVFLIGFLMMQALIFIDVTVDRMLNYDKESDLND